jgi:hypothetical protein
VVPTLASRPLPPPTPSPTPTPTATPFGTVAPATTTTLAPTPTAHPTPSATDPAPTATPEASPARPGRPSAIPTGTGSPEACYFLPEQGVRTGYLFLDLADPADMVRLSEPLFDSLGASVEFLPVMNLDDLRTALGGVGR